MAELSANRNDVVVILAGLEALAGCRREVRVPVRYLTMVHVEQAPMTTVSLFRFPGVAWPGAFAFGTRRRGGRREFAAVRAGVPAVVLEAEDTLWNRVVVSHRDAVEIAADLAALLLGRGPSGRGHGDRANGTGANGTGANGTGANSNGDRRRRSRQNGASGLTLDRSGVRAGGSHRARAEAPAFRAPANGSSTAFPVAPTASLQGNRSAYR
jgi:hypothetical protein